MRPINIAQHKNNTKFSHYKIRKKKTKLPVWKRRRLWKAAILVVCSIFLIGLVWGFVRFRKNVVKTLPDIATLSDISLAETSVITDRNGKVLYKLFDENREYVDYDLINENMINAIIALEDKRYREHGGLDYWGIIRAGARTILYGDLQGASTIEQQLLKNMLINTDASRETLKQKIVRKFQEALLTKKLEKLVKSEIKAKHGDINSRDLFLEQKKKNLELYLNYLDFGNSSYGVEAASDLYFNKSAKYLNILESSILSSVAKSASVYNPYTHKDSLVGQLIITNASLETIVGNSAIEKMVIDRIKKSLQDSTLLNKKDPGNFVQYIKGLTNFSLTYDGGIYNVEYINGRKDVALVRMFAEDYITEQELKDNFLAGLQFSFHRGGFNIKAPHFVFRVIEKLKQNYDLEILKKGGFIIKTTLDLDIQTLANEAIQGNYEKLISYGANNNAMIYLDSLNGDVLAYIGSIDYFNEEVGGQNDMVQAHRQVGSTMKPFVYSLGLETLPLSLDTPIYDIPFSVGGYTPNNADSRFMGILPLKYALGYSRNIPAVKMYFAVGGEDKLKPFFKKLGIQSLSSSHSYGYSLVLGAGEIPMIELANAYMHLSSPSKPAMINPILDIRGNDGSIVYQKKAEKQAQVIKPGVNYLLRRILSNRSNMPGSRAGAFYIKGINLAIKSGTSNMKTPKGSRARDGWLVTYTPNKVAIFRAGNADGSPLYRNAYGGFLNSNVMKSFWGNLVQNDYVTNASISQVEVSTQSISKISGLNVGANTVASNTVKSIGYINRPRDGTDHGMSSFKYDGGCAGKLSPFTDINDVKDGYLLTPNSFMPNNMDLEQIKNWRKRSTGQEQIPAAYSGRVNFNYDNMFVESPSEYCQNIVANIDDAIDITINNLHNKDFISQKAQILYTIHSDSPISVVSILIDDTIVQNKRYTNKDKLDVSDIIHFDTISIGEHNVSVIAIDERGSMNQAHVRVTIQDGDIIAPTLDQKQIMIRHRNDGRYDVLFVFEDNLSSIKSIEIRSSETLIKKVSNINIANFRVSELGVIQMKVIDAYGNIFQQDLDLSKI